MLKKQFLFAFVLFVLFASSCKREKTQWDTDWAAPIAHGHLTINDMIPVDLTETNDDGYLSLIINQSVLEFDIDSLFALPDTVISQKLSTGLPIVNFEEGDALPFFYDQVYDVGDIQLKTIRFSEGSATINVLSPWPGKLKVLFTLPTTTKGGTNLSRNYELGAGSMDMQAVGIDTIDLSGYTMNLTGEDNLTVNTFSGAIVVASDEPEPFTVLNTDSISFDFGFNGLVADYAKGFFGQHSFSDTIGFSLPQLKRIVSGSIDLDSIRLDVIVRNGFNLIAQARVSRLGGINTRTGTNVDLDFPELNNTLNINRASGGLFDYTPSEFPIEINNTNSNIIDFIENLSDSLIIGYDLEINPFGNVGAGDDELFPNSKMELFVDGEFPLNFGINDLTIVDTIDIDPFNSPESFSPGDAVIVIDYVNAFPVGATAQFYLIDENGIVIDSISSSGPIEAGINALGELETTSTSGALTFNFDQTLFDNLELTDQMALRVSFDSQGTDKVRIFPDSFFDFKMRTNLQISVSL